MSGARQCLDIHQRDFLYHMQYAIDLRLARTSTGFALDLLDGELFDEGPALAVLVESGALDARLNAFPAEAYRPKLQVIEGGKHDE